MAFDDPELCRLLTLEGYSNKEIENMTLETCLVKDLGLDGDTLCETLETLEKEFGVDLTQFHFERYSYTEGELLSFGRELNWLKRNLGLRHREFKPLTLRMIAKAIRTKKWPEPPD
jgi:Protein of unknown function (DUF1493)